MKNAKPCGKGNEFHIQFLVVAGNENVGIKNVSINFRLQNETRQFEHKLGHNE